MGFSIAVNKGDQRRGHLRTLAIAIVMGAALMVGCNFQYDTDALDAPGFNVGEEDALFDDAQDADSGNGEISCSEGEVVSNGECICEGQSREQLCEEFNVDACGLLTAEDRCGETRTVDCGGCDEEFGCSGAGICEACAVDCEDKCGFVAGPCGDLVDCSEGQPDPCDDGFSCQNNQCAEGDCEPATECDAGECGEKSDGCLGVISCSEDCSDGTVCQQNACVCEPESSQELCEERQLECGTETLIDRCENEREVDCGACSGAESCQENQCVSPPGLCDEIDLQSNSEHCGECEKRCGPTEACVEGDCEEFVCQQSQGTPQGSCDLFADESDCEDGEFCTLQLVLSGGVPSHFEPRCQPDTEIGDSVLGEECSQGSECGEGLFCVAWDNPDPRARICSKLCLRETNEGCESDEICTNPFEDELEGLGFCSPRCSPYQGSCGGGERCVADPAFPADTCAPNFRCLNNGGSGGKSEGSFCDRGALHQDGCPTGLTCFPAWGSDVCVTPCLHDDDCEQECIDGDSPWQSLRHCSL